MKRIAACSLAIVLLATSAWGQHAAAGSHAAFSHSNSGFSAGRSFSMSSSGPGRALGSSPAYHPNLSQQQRALYTSPIGPAPFGGTQPPNGRTDHNGGYRYNYGRGVYLIPGFLNSGFYGFGYPDSSYYGDVEQSAPPPVDPNAGNYGPENGPPNGYDQAYADAPARPVYQPQPAASTDVPAQPQVTLLFKDGRSPQQVQNYAVTRTTLYVFDGVKRRDIPLDQLDLPQTEKTNRAAGIDFQIPAAND